MRVVAALIAASLLAGCVPQPTPQPPPPAPAPPTPATPMASPSTAAPALAFPPSGTAQVRGPDVSRDGRGPAAPAGNDGTTSTSQVTTYNDNGAPGGATYEKQVVTQSTTTDQR